MPSTMEELERIAVQLFEAKRLAAYDDVAHVRLAFLLLDNAAEISLMRTARAGLVWAEKYRDLAESLGAAEDLDEEGKALQLDLMSQAISRKRQDKIESNFKDLVTYALGASGLDLPEEYGACAKALHRFRNAAYHRDHLHPDILQATNSIYFFLCCTFLLHEKWVMSEIGIIPSGVREILGEDTPQGTGPKSTGSVQMLTRAVAEHLLKDLNLDVQEVASALSRHLLGRLTALEADLQKIESETFPGLGRDFILRVLQQLPEDRRAAESEPPANFLTRQLPVTSGTLTSWRTRAESLQRTDEVLKALRAFADVEEPLTTLEKPVARFIDEIDMEVQREVDRRLGK